MLCSLLAADFERSSSEVAFAGGLVLAGFVGRLGKLERSARIQELSRPALDRE